jgi:hypothetical protein
MAERIAGLALKEGQQSVSYSQYDLYSKCKLSWHLKYVDKLTPRENTIHTLFGTAIHETIQNYVTIVYTESAKSADEIDLLNYYYDRFCTLYLQYKQDNNGENFISPDDAKEFYQDAKSILESIKKNRKDYFPSRGYELVGIELPLFVDIHNGIIFKGFIDIVIFNSNTGEYIIYDLKTSSRGWNEDNKKDRVKTSQMVSYKQYFSKQYGIPLEKIKCEYIILRRKINTDLEFPPKRIQHFVPPVGPRITKDFNENLINFLDASIPDGSYKTERPQASPSNSNCRFCYHKDKKTNCKFGIV